MPKRTPLPTHTEATPEDGDANFLVLVRTDAAPPPVLRGGAADTLKKVAGAAMRYVEVSPDLLQAQLSGFLAKMNKVVQGLPAVVGQFQLDEIELSVEVTGKGTVAFLGTGGELGTTGGLKLTLKRKP